MRHFHPFSNLSSLTLGFLLPNAVSLQFLFRFEKISDPLIQKIITDGHWHLTQDMNQWQEAGCRGERGVLECGTRKDVALILLVKERNVE